MQAELPNEQWAEVQSGLLTGPDGQRYQRRSTRMRRKQVDAMVAEGAPLVLFWYGGQQLTWFDREDVALAWDTVRPRLTSSTPRPDGDVCWTAGEWVSSDGNLVLLTGAC